MLWNPACGIFGWNARHLAGPQMAKRHLDDPMRHANQRRNMLGGADLAWRTDLAVVDRYSKIGLRHHREASGLHATRKEKRSHADQAAQATR